jgi:hypothetical protein
MIVHDFNNGWGNNFELRKFESTVVKQYLAPWESNASNSITVNSTWYNRDYHDQVIDYIKKNKINRVALISCMDPAIVFADWFNEVDVEVRSLGYYRGADEIDIWALIMDKYFTADPTTFCADQLDQAFVCYNRKPHWHRRKLFDSMQELDIIKHGVVTMGDSSGHAVQELDQDVEPTTIAPNPGKDQYGIVNDIMSLGPVQIWQRCFLNMVTETIYDVDHQWFVSEKIYKPVIGMRPFVVHAPNGAKNWLAHVGLLDYLDDFQDICDLDLAQPTNHALFLAQLSAQPRSYFQKKYNDLHSKILYNKEQFLEYVNQLKIKIQQGIY